jgi:alcohol dehydrogenase
MIKPHMIQLPIMTEFGNGASSRARSYAKILGKKSLIVTDKGVAKAGILKGIADSLDENKLEYAVFEGFMPNPIDTMVEKSGFVNQ